MKTSLIPAILVGLILALAFLPSVYATHDDKVTLCHKPGVDQKTLSVDDNAVQAHLDHGDYLGECNPPPPTECTLPQILVDGICVDPPVVCEEPQILVDGVCVNPPITCEFPEILVDGECINPPITCDEPQILVDGVCITPPPQCDENQVLQDGVCVDIPPVCEDGQILVDGQCVNPPIECNENEILIDGVCIEIVPTCDEGQVLVDGQCVTPQTECEFPQVLEDNVCVNPPDDTPICEYPQVLENNVCVTPEQPPVVLDDNIHHGCPGDCTPPTFGKLPSHRQYITHGFGINGNFYNVGEYFQEIRPVGGNVTTVFLKVYENSGVQDLDTVVLATGLTPDQYVGEGTHNIVIKFAYNGTVTSNGNVQVLNDGVFTYIFIQTDLPAGEKIGIQAYDRHLNVQNNFFLLKE